MVILDPVLSWLYFVALCIISCISLVANSIVLTWKPSNPNDRLHFTRLGHILRSHALSNLTTAIVTIPLWLFILIMGQTKHSSIVLDEVDDISFNSFDVVHQLLAALHLVAMVTERFCAIYRPAMHQKARDRLAYLTSVSCWLIASSVSSIIFVVYYWTKAAVITAIIFICCFGLPCLVIMVMFLLILLKLLKRELTPSRKIDVAISKEITLVFLFYLITCLPYHTLTLLKYFCSSFDHGYLSLSLGMRFFYYSSSAVTPVALIAFVPELRTRSQRFCFRLLAINEESRNDLYSIEIPGIHLKKSSCTLVKTAPRRQVSIPTVQENILL